MSVALSVIIPAHNEAGFILPCLEALVASQGTGADVEVIVVANGCTDNTVEIAQNVADRFAARGWGYQVLDLPKGGKMRALNRGDDRAQFGAQVYLDADVVVSPMVLVQIAKALDSAVPRYASGSPIVTSKGSRVSAAYARFWSTHHFVTHGAPGFGLFAVNEAGRTRWGEFPGIISDDTFVRLSFSPEERVRVPATYDWPIIEGFRQLVKVRRRQDIGVAEVERLFPHLLKNHDPVPVDAPGLVRRMLADPVGALAYFAVSLGTRWPARNNQRWARGR